MPDMIHNIANYLHVTAALALLVKIWWSANCAGISGKAQFLYVIVYTTRYLDLFTVFISKENTIMKIMYLSLGYCTLASVYIFFRKTYEKKYDTFRIELLVLPCLVIALIVNHFFEATEVLWTFSIYLESVAILPQFHFVAKAKRIHNHVLYYLLALAIYKGMYIIHWVYSFYYIYGYTYDRLTAASGIVQFLLYCDFFVRIVPFLSNNNNQEADYQPDLNDVYTMENGEKENNGHLTYNISTIVLTPASLIPENNEKVDILKAEEAMANNDVVQK